jgi:RimK family alpha-L-glutamate ligase
MRKNTAWIIYNSWLKKDKFITLFQHLLETMVKKNIDCEMIGHNELPIIQSEQGLRLIGKHQHKTPDFILFWDSDALLAKQLEMLGFRVFNSSSAIELCSHKGKTHTFLSQQHIAMPKTILSPRVAYQCSIDEQSQFYNQVIETLKLPLIIKVCISSFGSQVYLINTRQELIQRAKQLQYSDHLYQEFIHTSKSRDLRLQVIGGRVVAALRRISKNGDFRANITNGGEGLSYTPSPEETELAIQACQLVGVTFAGVDILFGEKTPILCEINSTAHIINLKEITGIDVAPIIMDEILAKI